MAETPDILTDIDRLGSARVLCIGDVMLDHYIHGVVERLSPEAPIPVLRIEREVKTLGGAGNVLRNLRAFGASASFISVIGNDDSGREVERLLASLEGVEIHVLVQPQRVTTVKTRYIAVNQQLLRADRESAAPLGPYVREDVLRLARELVRHHDVVVISDYAKGVLTEGVALELIRAAREAGTRIIVDPRGGDPIRYRGADLLIPSRRELGQGTGMPVGSESEIVTAARTLMERCAIGDVLVSLGSEGMLLVGGDGSVHAQPATPAVGPAASGVGDTVVAALAAALGGGLSAAAAFRLAAAAGGIARSKEGTAIAYASELAAFLQGSDPAAQAKIRLRDEAIDIVEGWRGEGLRIGFTNGCFDLLHQGHVALLAQAKAACDRLVVGVNADSSAARLKGSLSPVQGEATRAAALAALAVVDLVVVFGEDTPLELIQSLQPQLLVKGSNYRADQVIGAELVKKSGGAVMLAELMPNYGAAITATDPE